MTDDERQAELRGFTAQPDERLERLTELARRVLQQERAEVRVHRLGVNVVAPSEHGDWWYDLLSVPAHDRALDALEAALLVLNGQVPDALVGLAGETIVAIEMKYRARAFAWVEQLAADWECEANRMLGGLWPQAERDPCVRELKQCAAELRARAKGAERG